MSEEPGAAPLPETPPEAAPDAPAEAEVASAAAPAPDAPAEAAATDPTTAIPTPAEPVGAAGTPPPTVPVEGSTGGTGGGRNALIIGAVIVAAAIIVGALVIGQNLGSSSPSPAPSAAPTEAASAAPTATPEPTPRPHAHAERVRAGEPGDAHRGHADAGRRQPGLPAVLRDQRPGDAPLGAGRSHERQGIRRCRRLRGRRQARLREGEGHLDGRAVQQLVRARRQAIRLLHHPGLLDARAGHRRRPLRRLLLREPVDRRHERAARSSA